MASGAGAAENSDLAGVLPLLHADAFRGPRPLLRQSGQLRVSHAASSITGHHCW
jgi:hypothetical protein